MPLLLVKRRWPVLTTIVAALLYIVNNYDIRGLDTLRLEPRVSGGQSSSGLNPPAAKWPAAYPSSPILPTALPSAQPPSTSASYSADAGLTASGVRSGSGNYGTAIAYSGAAGDRMPILSVGEKLAMLDQAHAPAVLSGASSPSEAGAGKFGTVASGSSDAIRIASFNLHGWGDAKRANVAVAGLLSRLLGQFDLIALQDIRSRQDDVLPELVNHLNSGGRKFDFMIGPRVGRGERREQLGFIFDTERIETDRFQLYTVEDPEDMLNREPLVGWFRTVSAASQEAFTFSLVNLHIDPDLVASELQALPNLLQAIVNDGRGEDDILLAGDFSATAHQLEFLAASGMHVVLDGIATTTRGSQLLDNFAFPRASTSEYTGRSGSVDFLRQFNLSLEQALEVSEHLPIWAEFSIIEGGRPGQVAGNASPEHRFRNGAH